MKTNYCFLGDNRESMRRMLNDGYAGKIQTIITSPPYWGLRDYGVAGQLGQESSLREFLANMVEVFNLCRELLSDDGTCWVNMGDSYASKGGQGPMTGKQFEGRARANDNICLSNRSAGIDGLKSKDLCGQPWRLAFALQDAGWYLRQDIIWHKPNPMPESVRDRCTKAHEYLFLLTKSERYFYDFAAMQEPVNGGAHARLPGNGVGFGHRTDKEQRSRGRQSWKTPDGWDTTKGDGGHGSVHKQGREKGRKLAEAGSGTKNNESMDAALAVMPETRNRRSVWTIPTESFAEAHFATFPQALVEPCILAGSRPGDIVFDPFLGSGTVAQVAQNLGRKWLGCELNPEYVKLQDDRTRQAGLILETAA
jgi:DNA modification methylase